MKKLLMILGGVLGLVMVVVAGAALYIANFDPNDNKEWIAGKFNESTGRDISFGGDIGLTIYPWLGVTLNDVSVSNAAGFSDNPFLQADQAAVRIKLMPLLRGEYEIDTVRLNGVRANLEVAGNGDNNWSSLAGQSPAEAEAAGDAGNGAPGKIIIGGVDIQNTSVIYDDQSANTHYEINNLSVQIGELVYGQPLDVRMAFAATSRNPQLRSNMEINGTVLYDVDNGLYQLDPLRVEGTLQGPSVPSGSANITLATALRMNTEEDTLALSNLQLSALDTEVNANVTATNLQTETPSVNATLDVVGNDLSLLFRILEQNELATRIRNLDNDFNIEASVDANMETGDVTVPTLEVSMLGATVTGNLIASEADTDAPTVSGNLKAEGPDLPTLIEVLGILQQGRDSALAQTGRDLGRVSNKRFSLQTQFSADMKDGNIQLPALEASMLGFQLTGALDAKDIQSGGGSIGGNLRMSSNNLREVLNALNQQGLAEIAQSLDLDVQLGGTGDNVLISPLNISLVVAGGQLGPAAQTLALNADTQMNLKNDSLEVDEFTLSGLGLNLNGAFSARNLSTDLAYEGRLNLPAFNARRFMNQLNLEAPQTTDSSVLQNIVVDADFSGTGNSVNLSSFKVALDDSNITGNLNITDLAVMSGNFTVDIDEIDADRYLAPPSDSPAAVTSAEPSPLPVDDLRALNLHGVLNIGQLTISGLKMASISVPLDAANGVVALNPVKASLYDGTFDGSINLNVAGLEPVATVATTLAGISMSPLMQDFLDATYVTGNGNIELSLEGRGIDAPTIKRNLNGSGRVALEDGVLSGVDVGSTLAVVETMVRSKKLLNLPQGGETPFDTFSATLAIDNGVVSSNDLLISAPGWRLTGSGTLVNLDQETIAFNMVTAVDEATAKVEEQEYDIGGHTLPIACTGAISSPRCLPDAKAIVASAVTNAVQDRIGAFLQDRLRGDEQTPTAEGDPVEQPSPQDPLAPQDEPANQQQPADQQPQQEEKTVEEEVINRALDRLFR